MGAQEGVSGARGSRVKLQSWEMGRLHSRAVVPNVAAL